MWCGFSGGSEGQVAESGEAGGGGSPGLACSATSHSAGPSLCRPRKLISVIALALPLWHVAKPKNVSTWQKNPWDCSFPTVDVFVDRLGSLWITIRTSTLSPSFRPQRNLAGDLVSQKYKQEVFDTTSVAEPSSEQADMYMRLALPWT